MSSPNYLFYSDKCPHSRKMIQMLERSPIASTFKRISVDNLRSIPNGITTVPTIVVPNQPRPLTGRQAFEWIEKQNEPKVELPKFSNKKIEAFFPQEMNSSFSDNYAYIGKKDSNIKHSFEFINDKSKNHEMNNEMNNEKEYKTKKDLDTLMKQRADDMKIKKPYQRI